MGSRVSSPVCSSSPLPYSNSAMDSIPIPAAVPTLRYLRYPSSLPYTPSATSFAFHPSCRYVMVVLNRSMWIYFFPASDWVRCITPPTPASTEYSWSFSQYSESNDEFTSLVYNPNDDWFYTTNKGQNRLERFKATIECVDKPAIAIAAAAAASITSSISTSPALLTQYLTTSMCNYSFTFQREVLTAGLKPFLNPERILFNTNTNQFVIHSWHSNYYQTLSASADTFIGDQLKVNYQQLVRGMTLPKNMRNMHHAATFITGLHFWQGKELKIRTAKEIEDENRKIQSFQSANTELKEQGSGCQWEASGTDSSSSLGSTIVAVTELFGMTSASKLYFLPLPTQYETPAEEILTQLTVSGSFASASDPVLSDVRSLCTDRSGRFWYIPEWGRKRIKLLQLNSDESQSANEPASNSSDPAQSSGAASRPKHKVHTMEFLPLDDMSRTLLQLENPPGSPDDSRRSGGQLHYFPWCCALFPDEWESQLWIGTNQGIFIANRYPIERAKVQALVRQYLDADTTGIVLEYLQDLFDIVSSSAKQAK